MRELCEKLEFPPEAIEALEQKKCHLIIWLYIIDLFPERMKRF